MKLLVLGNSDYNGSLLADPLNAWPHLVGGTLAKDVETKVEVVNLNFIPRRIALPVAEALIAEHQPELVVVGLNPYSFAVTTVVARVRQRMGNRAARGYSRIEHAFDRRTRTGRVGPHLNRMARRVARSTIGAAPLAPVEQIIETYRSVFDRLAHEEQTQVVIMGGSKLSLNPRLINGRLLAQVDQFRAAMSAAAEQHRFPFFDTEPTVAGPDRESYFLPDGVHRNDLGHRRLADMIYPVIADEVRRLGLVTAGG